MRMTLHPRASRLEHLFTCFFALKYPLALRLVALGLLIPADTSECERVFSLMNNIKTAERSRMLDNLKRLMLWHRWSLGGACSLPRPVGGGVEWRIPCTAVPVMDIIKEWRLMAGPKGRTSHRPAPVPVYEYQKGLTAQAKHEQAKAQADCVETQ